MPGILEKTWMVMRQIDLCPLLTPTPTSTPSPLKVQDRIQHPLGDDFSNFEEYRGIVYTPTIGGNLTHIRLDPFRKDLFIRAQGFGDAPGDPYRDVIQPGQQFLPNREGFSKGRYRCSQHHRLGARRHRGWVLLCVLSPGNVAADR